MILIFASCQEPIPLQSIDFEDMLVVEGTITNEFKHHKVKLSRTYNLEEDFAPTEDGATVWIESSNGNIFTFSQNGNGEYLSDIEFETLPNTQYQLFIETSQGKHYQSSAVELTPVSQIDNLYAELVTLDTGEIGIQVFVDSNNEGNDAEYFRYEYDETYKIVAPEYIGSDIVISNVVNTAGNLSYDIDVVLSTENQLVCYKTQTSEGIIQASSENYSSNILERVPIRFIPIDNGIIRDRYSILVKQYVENLEAYTYYNTIFELGNNGSILSQSQPGFILGNITSEDDTSTRAIGYFQASTITSERIFLSYDDFGIQKPPYLFECEEWTLDYADATTIDGDRNERFALYNYIELYDYELLRYSGSGSVYVVINPECSNCTYVSDTNIEPDFWEE